MEVVPNYNFFNIFMISATIQGLLFSVILLFSKKFNTVANKFLTFTILFISVNNLYYWFISTNLWIVLGWKCYKVLFISWDLLILPMYMYFVASYLGLKLNHVKYYKYPFFISLIVHVIIVVSGFLIQDFFKTYGKVIYVYDVIINYFSPIFAIFIVYKIFRLIFDYEKGEQRNLNNAIPIKTKWLKQLLYACMSFCLISITILVYNTFNTSSTIYQDAPINDDFMWAILSIFVYWLSYSGIYHVGIFNQRQSLRAKIESDATTSTYKNSTGKIERFFDIDNIIKSERLYTNPSISLNTIAERFSLSEGYISQLINNNTNTNFPTYINNLRVIEAQRILFNTDYQEYTIVAVGLESGFNSKSAFYNAFKKYSGISPLEYKKSRTLS